jgi:hypothetical protein
MRQHLVGTKRIAHPSNQTMNGFASVMVVRSNRNRPFRSSRYRGPSSPRPVTDAGS